MSRKDLFRHKNKLKEKVLKIFKMLPTLFHTIVDTVIDKYQDPMEYYHESASDNHSFKQFFFCMDRRFVDQNFNI